MTTSILALTLMATAGGGNTARHCYDRFSDLVPDKSVPTQLSYLGGQT